jgi:hypothetical protein
VIRINPVEDGCQDLFGLPIEVPSLGFQALLKTTPLPAKRPSVDGFGVVGVLIESIVFFQFFQAKLSTFGTSFRQDAPNILGGGIVKPCQELDYGDDWTAFWGLGALVDIDEYGSNQIRYPINRERAFFLLAIRADLT